MRQPKKRNPDDYEKVRTDDFVTGRIVDIALDENHKFTFQGKEKIGEAVRFTFEVDGCQYPHKSRWMRFNYGQKSTLYQIFLSSLVEDAEPDMEFDLDDLKGMSVKMLWNTTDNGFQYIQTIRAVESKRKRCEAKE